MDHISTERLLAVAKGDLVFTDVEFDHVNQCLKCFGIWMEPIREKGPGVVWSAFEKHIANRGVRLQRPSERRVPSGRLTLLKQLGPTFRLRMSRILKLHPIGRRFPM